MNGIAAARSDLYRQRILTAAEIEFARAGFTEARMQSIAQGADLSLATVYKTFSGKTEIWDCLHAERMTDLLASVDAATTGASPLDRLLGGVAQVATYLAEHDHYLELSLKEGITWTRTEAGVGAQRTVWTAGLESLVSGFEAALARGEITGIRPAVAAGMMVSALQVWLSDWVQSGRDRPSSEVVEEMTTYLRRMLGAPK